MDALLAEAGISLANVTAQSLSMNAAELDRLNNRMNAAKIVATQFSCKSSSGAPAGRSG
ncbi:hypothetical protein QEV83_08050 [Methylocapsa sp. D3K7]|uniref:hypothetical protein n=1 Tax=Methylocapsa sp. D3K7 TaxID=3041435 RepID=UPI00244E7AB8|nr:hypothetical protein [Methylocapsa sp. D3K7]WGJ16183.1 hypothetical protein QEV83_08050 [Methylocapsa sp. D3K7]